MVLHFPNKLTEEEEALQLKYAKLRRKKKQLQEVNKPKQEPKSTITAASKAKANNGQVAAKQNKAR